MKILERIYVGLIVTLLVVFALGIGYGAWRIEKWFNWRYGYGPQVEGRLETIERRLDALEKR